MKLNSLSDLFDAIREDNIDYVAVLDYISERETAAYKRGFNQAVDLYHPLLKTEVSEV